MGGLSNDVQVFVRKIVGRLCGEVKKCCGIGGGDIMEGGGQIVGCIDDEGLSGTIQRAVKMGQSLGLVMSQ